jgi:protein phosphatase
MRLPRLEIASESNLGRKRRNNEDFHRVTVFPTSAGNLVMLAVADGMGGSEAGEWASKLAIEGLTEAVRLYAQHVSAGKPAVPLERVVEKAFRHSQRIIRQEVVKNPNRKGMGTTMTAVVVAEWNRSGVLGHVGDTRAYVQRAGRWKQISQDHSWVAQQVRQGILTTAQAEAHPWKHMLTQALGLEDVQEDVATVAFQPNDLLVLATDGLYGLVPPEEWDVARDLQSTLEEWIARALVRGGTDNITAIAARFYP